MTRQRWGDIGLAILAALTVLLVWLAFDRQNRVSQQPVAVPATTAVTPSPSVQAKPRAVFIGDSYTAGVGSDGTRWTTLVAENRGWEEVNLANAGTGYMTSVTGSRAQSMCGKATCPKYGDVVPDAVAAAPDIVIISGGRNDQTKDISAAAASLLTDLHKQLPNAQIIVFNPLWDDDATPLLITTQTKALTTATKNAGVTMVDVGQPFAGKSALISTDGVNPNAAGQRALAELAITRLAAVKQD